MANTLCFILVLQVLVSFRCLVHCNIQDTSTGPGEPLFLTPYIERGDVAEARKLARVPLLDNLNVESYAGFFTVNKTYDSNHFFWYIPSMSANRTNDPVIIWLPGGPGTSGIKHVFLGNGPVTLWNDTFVRTKYHWAQNHHMIFVDNPVGTGFSFTNNSDGYCTDQTQVGEQLYSTITQFFKLFPELQQNRFFIAGVSYGGKYVPALAYTIHKKNPTAETKINLKGLAIGDGFSDPENQLMYGKYLYQIGLIDVNQRKIFEEYEAKCSNHIKNEQWEEAFITFATLMFGETSYFHNFTGSYNSYTFLEFIPDTREREVMSMMERDDVRRAIHVGNLPYAKSHTVYSKLIPDFMKSVAPWMSELLDHYHCMVYNGQVDIIVAYPLTLNYLQKLRFSGAEEYKTAKREIWRVEGEVAGYVRRGGNLVEVMVRNAGHGVTADQPKWAQAMIEMFTKHAK